MTPLVGGGLGVYHHAAMGLGVLLGLGASASWACANIYVQRAGQAVGAMRALFWTQLLGVLALGLIAALGGDARTGVPGFAELGWLLVAGLASLLGYLGMFDAFERGSLSLAVPIMSSWSLVSALVAVAIFGERLRTMQACGGLLVVAGVLVVARFASSQPAASLVVEPIGGQASRAESAAAARSRSWLPSVFAGAIGFGVLIPVVDRLAPTLGRFGAIGAVFVADLLLGLPLAAFFKVSLRPPPRAAYGVVLAASFFETLGFICVSLAGRRAPMALVSPLASLASALTVLFAWFWLRERPTRSVMLGAALACAGVISLAF